jgi:hypothetical protein
MRRFLIIIGALILVIGLTLGVYLLFFSAKAPTLTVEDGTSFGVSGDYVPQGSADTPKGEVGETKADAGETVAPRLVRITDTPVAFGAVAFGVRETVSTQNEGTSTATSTTTRFDTEVRYLERASGNAFAYRVGERTLTRLSNRTLPGVYEASWLSDGSKAYARFLSKGGNGEETLETYMLPLVEGETGYFLEPDLSEIAVRGTSTVVTLLPSASGSIATAASPKGDNVRTIFSTPLSALQLLISGNSYAAYTNASAQKDGYGFLVGSGGTLERVLGPLRGLAVLPSPSGTYLFYTYLSGSALRSELLETASRVATAIPINTMAEKCVWAPDEMSVYCAVPRSISGTLPDDWYQGATSFSDRIWKVDLSARVAVLIIDPQNAGGVAIDATNLAIDEKEDVLVFTNKTDGSLWAYDL